MLGESCYDVNVWCWGCLFYCIFYSCWSILLSIKILFPFLAYMLTRMHTIPTCLDNKPNYLYASTTCLHPRSFISYMPAYHACLPDLPTHPVCSIYYRSCLQPFHSSHVRLSAGRLTNQTYPACMPTYNMNTLAARSPACSLGLPSLTAGLPRLLTLLAYPAWYPANIPTYLYPNIACYIDLPSLASQLTPFVDSACLPSQHNVQVGMYTYRPCNIISFN